MQGQMWTAIKGLGHDMEALFTGLGDEGWLESMIERFGDEDESFSVGLDQFADGKLRELVDGAREQSAKRAELSQFTSDRKDGNDHPFGYKGGTIGPDAMPGHYIKGIPAPPTVTECHAGDSVAKIVAVLMKTLTDAKLAMLLQYKTNPEIPHFDLVGAFRQRFVFGIQGSFKRPPFATTNILAMTVGTHDDMTAGTEHSGSIATGVDHQQAGRVAYTADRKVEPLGDTAVAAGAVVMVRVLALEYARWNYEPRDMNWPPPEKKCHGGWGSAPYYAICEEDDNLKDELRNAADVYAAAPAAEKQAVLGEQVLSCNV